MEISLEPFQPEAMPQRLAVHRAFDVRQVRVGDAVIVEVIGEIDMSTAPKLAGAVSSVPETTRRVVVDLSEVSFLDSSALSALVHCQRGLVQRAIELRVVCPEHSPARKALEISALIGPLAVIETLDAALARAALPG